MLDMTQTVCQTGSYRFRLLQLPRSLFQHLKLTLPVRPVTYLLVALNKIFPR